MRTKVKCLNQILSHLDSSQIENENDDETGPSHELFQQVSGTSSNEQIISHENVHNYEIKRQLIIPHSGSTDFAVLYRCNEYSHVTDRQSHFFDRKKQLCTVRAFWTEPVTSSHLM